MSTTPELIAFHVVPGPKGLDEAERLLREAGFDQIKRSRDGRHLRAVGSKDLIERVFGFSLVERQKRGRVGPVERRVSTFELPEEAVVPASLEDVLSEIIIPVAPDYHTF